MNNSIRHRTGVQRWNPSYAYNLTGWYDAADKNTITVNGSNQVSEWRDKSSAAIPFYQTTDADKPLSNVRSLAGLNLIDFDGVSDLLLTDYGLGSSIFEVHMVTVIDSTALQSIATASAGPFEYRIIDEYNVYVEAGTVLPTTLPHSITGANLHGILIDGYGSQIYSRGEVRVTGNAGNGTWGATAWLGSYAGYMQYFDGAIGEIIAYSGNDGTQRQKIEGYLAWKWGLIWQLPTTHPYKQHPPLAGDI